VLCSAGPLPQAIVGRGSIPTTILLPSCSKPYASASHSLMCVRPLLAVCMARLLQVPGGVQGGTHDAPLCRGGRWGGRCGLFRPHQAAPLRAWPHPQTARPPSEAQRTSCSRRRGRGRCSSRYSGGRQPASSSSSSSGWRRSKQQQSGASGQHAAARRAGIAACGRARLCTRGGRCAAAGARP
jgi:hypothetical protein